MSSILTLFAGGTIDYLLLTSLLAVILTPLVGAIIEVARIRAPIYRHMIWLHVLIGVVVFPAIWLYGPILTFEILPAEDQPAKAVTPEMDSRYDVKFAQGPPTEMHSPRLISTEAAVMDHANPPLSGESRVGRDMAFWNHSYADPAFCRLAATSPNLPVSRTCIWKWRLREYTRREIKSFADFSGG